MSDTRTGTAPSTASLARDPGLGRVTARGPDAADFLEAQSMTALAGLADRRLRRCAFADSKGRVVATAIAWHTGDDWRLLLPATEAEWFVSHLLRFRFRSKVEIEAGAQWRVAALFGDGIDEALAAAGLERPETGMALVHDGVEVAMTADNHCLLAAGRERMSAVLDALASACIDVEPSFWRGVNMQSGDAAIREATRGRFLPQFLDFDTREVIAWDKGCYPGQEVIARLQHRGTVKHRLLLLAEAIDAAPGTRADIAGVTVDVIDHGTLPDGTAVTQVVAPYPFDPALDSLAL